MKNSNIIKNDDPEVCGDCGENINDCECWHGGITD
jgi:hypothetical protein